MWFGLSGALDPVLYMFAGCLARLVSYCSLVLVLGYGVCLLTFGLLGGWIWVVFGVCLALNEYVNFYNIITLVLL